MFVANPLHMNSLELVPTGDGTGTLYSAAVGDHYHSTHGARQESEYVFISQGLAAQELPPASVLEIGFGTGLNAFLSALWAQQAGRPLYYTSVDILFPEDQLTRQLGYAQNPAEAELFDAIASAPVDKEVRISNTFTLHKRLADFTQWQPERACELVFFDAFGPDKQPAMWEFRQLEKLCKALPVGGLWVTYSAKGQVRRNLQAAGMQVERLPGPPGKREMLRAKKIAE